MESKGLKKVLTWAGILALVTIPVVVYIRKRRARFESEEGAAEEDIFSGELESDR